MFAAWILFPLILLALCCGLGLLVNAILGGRRLPGALIPPTGLAAIVVVAGFTTLSDATAPLTVPVVVLLAGLGFVFSLPWRFGRPDRWTTAAAFGVFAVYAAPIVFSGDPTFAGYIKLDDTATWLAMTDRVMEHGRSLSGLEPSTYRATLAAYSGDGYPIGANLPLGVATALSGQDAAWVFQPYLAYLAAMLALTLHTVCARFIASSRQRALAAFVAAQAALLYGYVLWGGMKEIAAAVLIGLIAALAPTALRGESPSRSVAPLAVGVAALVITLSLAGLVWVAPLLLVVAILAVRSLGPREVALRAAWLLGIGALLSIPWFATGRLTPPLEHSATSNAVLNLVQPLNPLQVVGIWPTGDFRFRPDGIVAAYVLVALAAASALIGLAMAIRGRAWTLLGYLATSALTGLAFVVVASPWVEGKALATASPALLLAAIAGAIATRKLDRLVGGFLVAVVAGGVLWSNILAYGGASLAPYGAMHELQTIGNDFAGRGPALMTEYNPYGARHFLRKLDAEGASELRYSPVPLRNGRQLPKGESANLDDFALSSLLAYRTLVIRRSPAESRPPSPFGLAWRGRYYDVWVKGDAPAPVDHLPLGTSVDPAAAPECADVMRLARKAGAGGRLIAAPAERPLAFTVGSASLSGSLAPLSSGSSYIEPNGGGSFTLKASLPRRGVYGVWLGGSIRPSATLLIDGHEVGSLRQQLTTVGDYLELGSAPLAAGTHTFTVKIGAAGLYPGSAGSAGPVGPLLIARPNDDPRLVTVFSSQARSLCGTPWDWVEAVTG